MNAKGPVRYKNKMWSAADANYFEWDVLECGKEPVCVCVCVCD